MPARRKPNPPTLDAINRGALGVFLEKQTMRDNSNTAALSLDDFGVRAFNRRNHYPTWAHLPKPNFLTNQTQVATPATLSDSAVTYPFLTNIFDLACVEVYRTNFVAGNKIFDTGDWYACDWHNRKFLLFTNTPTTLSLWLASYRPGITTTNGFTNATPSSVNRQRIQHTLSGSDPSLKVRIKHTRRVSKLSTPSSYFPITERTITTNDLIAVVCPTCG